MKVGIEAIHFDIPKIYLPIETLAKARNIEAEKLQKGLGLERMSFPDIYQDSVVFGANAVKKLIDNEKLQPNDIDRIYVGTESAVDGSKPVASYIITLIEEQCFEENSLSHVDVVDLTFACIGGVDALQNSLDFVRANPSKKVIVVCTDIAKYDLESTGEYTQGAGAIALLISANPSILSIENNWAVSTKGVFDFFKPRRRVDIQDIEFKNSEVEFHDSVIEIFREQPVFDGQYSNACYLERTYEAYQRLKTLKGLSDNHTLFSEWSTICMHLPYCFQARRIFTDFYINDTPDLKIAFEQADDKGAFKKEVSKSEGYQQLVKEKIAPTESASGKIGNMYTASIFMGMLSALCLGNKNNSLSTGNSIGFLAYGSGSKAKAFEGLLENDWKEKIKQISLFSTLDSCSEITLEEYIRLHNLSATKPIKEPKQEFYLDRIESEKGVKEGARYYKFAP